MRDFGSTRAVWIMVTLGTSVVIAQGPPPATGQAPGQRRVAARRVPRRR